MAQQEFIPYEQALELKELGFDELSLDAYYKTTDGGVSLVRFPDEERQINYPFERIPAPLYQQAFRWFREKYNLMYIIEEVWEEDTEYYVVEITTHNRVDDFLQECTYEEAELACLKKLIKIVKNKLNMAQTAVEWFIDRIKNQHLYGFTPLHELEEQAKAMEKEQIINASNKFANSLGIDKEDIEQYYNETFNK